MEFDEKEYLHAQLQVCHQKLFNLLRDNATLESQIMLHQRHEYATQQENTSLRQTISILQQRAAEPTTEPTAEPTDEAIDDLEEILGCGCDGEEAEAEAAIAE